MTFAYTAKVAVSITKAYVFGGHDGTVYLQDTDQFDPVADVWVSKTDIGGLMDNFGAARLDDKGYIYGGETTGGSKLRGTREYDPVGDSWVIKSAMTAPARDELGYSDLGGSSGYAIAGFSASGDVSDNDRYDPDIWTSKTDHPLAGSVGGQAAFTLNNVIYTCGGTAGGAQTADVRSYVDDGWSTRTSMGVARNRPGAFSIKSKGYVVGGENNVGSGKDDVEEYSPDTWTAKGNMLENLSRMAYTAVNEKGYLFGGRGGPPLGSQNTVAREYVSTTDTWATKTDMPTPARRSFPALAL